jgi:hypothetical protein
VHTSVPTLERRPEEEEDGGAIRIEDVEDDENVEDENTIKIPAQL